MEEWGRTQEAVSEGILHPYHRRKRKHQRRDPDEVRWLKESRTTSSCHLPAVDTNTVNRYLRLSEDRRKVTRVEELQPYPESQDRFAGCWPQLLCRDALAGHCYWEVDWTGVVDVSVSYRGVKRRGLSDCVFGMNRNSWSLRCCDVSGYSVQHRGRLTPVSPAVSQRAAVFVDVPAGRLSFYEVDSASVKHLHTFRTTFTKSLYAGFGFWCSGSSVHLRFPGYEQTSPTAVDAHLLKSSEESETCGAEEPESHQEIISAQVEADEQFYRLECSSPGMFQCPLTGLVFVMTQKADLRYRIVQWDESLLHTAGRTPAGPLYEIICPERAISQLHFPHCETDEAASTCLSAVHISDGGEMSVMKPRGINDSHVIVDVCELSALGLVWDMMKRFIQRSVPVAGQVLLYQGAPNQRTQKKKLYVFLLPRNIPKDQVSKDQRDNKYIQATSNCKLVKDQRYVLSCPKAPDTYKIQPKVAAEFDLNFGEQYHPTFEVRLPIDLEEETIRVQDEANSLVWEYDVDLTDVFHPEDASSQSHTEVNKKLLSVRTQLVQRVSEEVLHQLIDHVFQRRIMSQEEMEICRRKPKGDGARYIIDVVMNKGSEACKVVFDKLQELDPFLCRHLNLM